MKIRGPTHAVRDVGEVPGTFAVQYSDAVQSGHRCDAVVGPQHRAGAVRAVAVAVIWICVVVHKVETGADPPDELRVVGVDAGVDHVHVYPSAVVAWPGGVHPVEGEIALADSVKAPQAGLELGDVDA